jgi:tRNA(Ile)-lysidine synthase
MIEEVRRAINKHGMFEKEDRVVVAVSGGADSIALLVVLKLLSNEYGISLVSAHLNHGIRKEQADREEAFVRRFIRDMGIDFESEKINVPDIQKGSGKSIEEVGREERFRFLINVAGKYGANKIALGHHMHDQAETVIMNLLRGSGTEGMKGMLPVRDGMFVRPLLYITREEIRNFLEQKQIPFIMDPSNESNIYLRNRIRHELIPELKRRFNPRLEEALGTMSEIMRLENEYLGAVTDHVLKNWGVKLNDEEIRIKISELINLHPAIRHRVIKILLKRFGSEGVRVGYSHVKSVVSLADGSRPGGRVILPCRICVRREYDDLCFGTQGMENNGREREFRYNASIPGEVQIKELGSTMKFEMVQMPESIILENPNMVYMDLEKIILPVVVRTIMPGDKIQPLGMSGKKKLKSFFIDMKIPQIKRKTTPLLVDAVSVIWIAGMRMSERVKITEKSRIFLKVEII